MTKSVFALLFTFLTTTTAQAQEVPSKFTYQGRVTHSNGNPVEDATVTYTVQVRSADGACLLFEETHVRNMTNTNGVFSLFIGAGSNTGATSLNLKQVFDNTSLKVGANGCTYSPISGDIRKLRFTYDTGSEVVTLPQDQSIVSVPYAMNSNLLQGYGPGDFFKAGTGLLTQVNLNLLLNNTTNLVNLANGTSNLYANANYFPSTSGLQQGQFLTWDSTLNKWVGLTLNENIIPVITQPGRISGNVIINGTIGGTTIINTTGSITSSVNNTTTVNTQNVRIFNSSNTNKITINAPVSLSQDLTWNLPLNAGSNGYKLQTDGLGNLSWGRIILTDLRSTIGGLLFPTGCSSDQTWNYQSATDSFICVNFTIQGKAISSTPAVNGDVLKYNSSNQQWEPSQLRNPFSNAQVFDASGSYTVPAGVTRLYVQAWGGGGGGGGGANVLNLGLPVGIGGGGGGAGAYGATFVTVTPGQTVTITVGSGGVYGSVNNAGSTGGISSFGSFFSVSGGIGGGAGSTASALGGTSATATVNLSGGRGSPANAAAGGLGGSSPSGGSGGPGASGSLTPTVGFDGTAPGGAGGGGTSTTAGGAGAAGRVVVFY